MTTKTTNGDTGAIRTDLCILGGGAAGLSMASTAAILGIPCVLIETAELGGECLHSGCIPSKALIAAADAAWSMRQGVRFGLRPGSGQIDRDAVQRHIEGVIADITPTDSMERYRALGVHVIRGQGRFLDDRRVAVGETIITARRFVIATGSTPMIPPIPGLADIAYLTNETLFALKEVPRRLVIIGGGAIGLEMAQAHQRLGAEVTVVEAGSRILAREDADLIDVLVDCLKREGVRFITGASVTGIQPAANGMTIDVTHDGKRDILTASHLLIATGRQARTSDLGLDRAGVALGRNGIVTDTKMRTSNRRIYAIGDCCEGPRMTHAAGYQAGIAFRHAVFRLPVKADYAVLPRTVFCDPELATAGLTEHEAAQNKGLTILRFPFAENDRARCEAATDGLVKVMADRKGRVLGVGIVGRQAGDLITPWLLAMRHGLKVTDLADLTMAYPTRSEASRRAALNFYRPKTQNPWVQRLARLVRALG